jgi:hypothetical protein
LFYFTEEQEEDTMDVFSPFGVYTFTKEPTLENLFKASFIPVMAGTGFTLASLLNTMPGQGYNLLHGLANRADNLRYIAHQTGRALVGTVRRTPGMIAMAVLYGAGHVLQDLYHGLSGMYIGDMRFHR